MRIEESRMEDLKHDEALRIPEDIDYFNLKISLPNEARELLAKHRPSSVRVIIHVR